MSVSTPYPLPTRKPAIAYTRSSDPETQAGQRAAIDAYAASAGFEIVAEFADGFGTGSDGVETRPGFAKLLRQIELQGARTIIVERASHFVMDPISREVAYIKLREHGIEMISADSSAPFLSDPAATPIIYQVLEASSKLDQVITLSLKRGTQTRRRAKTGENWRRTYAEMAPEATSLAKRLNQNSRRSGVRITLRDISAQLAAAGFVTRDSKPYHPEAIRRMLKGAWPKSLTL
jgi:DNA invertase Pin-like site-specific DNA recombinase